MSVHVRIPMEVPITACKILIEEQVGIKAGVEELHILQTLQKNPLSGLPNSDYHPNICRFFEAYMGLYPSLDITSRARFLIFEKCMGANLRAEILIYRNGQPFLEKECAKIVTQVLAAMEFFHAKKIMHRDLKPENLMLAPDLDHIKIIDFGLASTDKTSTERFREPKRFASPQQFDESPMPPKPREAPIHAESKESSSSWQGSTDGGAASRTRGPEFYTVLTDMWAVGLSTV